MDIPVEKRFKILCEITRAQHFAWRQAVLTLAPDLDPVELTNKMWEITGIQTAEAYLKHIDPNKPLAKQVAQSISFSSLCMGEDVSLKEGDGDEMFLTHHACPWYDWHKRLDLLNEDQPGCDTWFENVVAHINQTLGTNITVETQCSLPDGGDCCRRRISCSASTA